MDDLRFHCVICGTVLEVAPRHASGVMECHSCLRIVPIPSAVTFPHEKAGAVLALPQEILALEMKILCGKCEAKLRLDARLEGQAVTCPICAAEIRVPVWSRSPETTRSSAATLSTAEIEFLSAALDPA